MGALAVCLLLLLVPPEQRAATSAANGAVAVEMRNIRYHFTGSISVYISQLRGELVPTRAGEIPVFDDDRSFLLQIDSGEIHMPLLSLQNVLNQQVFAAKDAPLKDIAIRVEKGRLKVKGKLHDRGDISFETESTLTVTDDGRMRLHAQKIKALHLPLKGLLDLFGVTIANLIHTSKLRGIEAQGDDLILDAQQILPPPQIRGRITAVEVRDSEIVQRFGEARVPAPSMTGNYMSYRGNRLRFGKLTMQNTDMVLIDMDARDPFDFYLSHYQQQLTAGYTKITPQFGLRVYMRDFNKLGK
jgi:hypothetical protein